MFGAFGRSTDQGKRLEERYEGLDGAARFSKNGVDTLKNGIEGYGFAQIANDAKPLSEELSQMTDEARWFLERVMESDTPMEVYSEKSEKSVRRRIIHAILSPRQGNRYQKGQLKNETSSAFDSMDSKIAGTT